MKATILKALSVLSAIALSIFISSIEYSIGLVISVVLGYLLHRVFYIIDNKLI